MSIFKMNQREKLLGAQRKASRAVIIFKDTLKELRTSNDILSEFIIEEEHQMFQHKTNIMTAKESIASNVSVIDRLKDFVVE